MALTNERVWIELSGLPPSRLNAYYAKHNWSRLIRRMIFGTDWPGIPGIAKNARAVAALCPDDETDGPRPRRQRRARLQPQTSIAHDSGPPGARPSLPPDTGASRLPGPRPQARVAAAPAMIIDLDAKRSPRGRRSSRSSTPAVAVVLGALLLHERITVVTVVAFALILVGSVLSTRRPAAVAEAAPVGAELPTGSGRSSG